VLQRLLGKEELRGRVAARSKRRDHRLLDDGFQFCECAARLHGQVSLVVRRRDPEFFEDHRGNLSERTAVHTVRKISQVAARGTRVRCPVTAGCRFHLSS